ncbi:MAG TPA: four helix bundle protein [Candidatus Wolfebacteria bacterium]|nr:four helix bundle protein [Candidatus Wolfebacteria bacterium]
MTKKQKSCFFLILKIVKNLPKEYRYELGSQIIRSTFSIILNIAEGSGKASDKELNRFIEIALGSVNETLAGVDVLKDNGFIMNNEFSEVYQKLDSISSQLGGFKKQLDK